MDHSTTIIQMFDEILNEKNCFNLCRKCNFIQRSTSKLKGAEFIKTLILPSEGLSEDSLTGLCKRIREFNPEADLSAQALSERINDSSSSLLMRSVLGQIMFHAYSKVIHRCLKLATTLSNFNAVLIEDSTIAKLNAKLKKTYPGSNRGKNAISQIKIDLIYDIMNGQIVNAETYSGKVPDQALAGRIINYVKPGDLVIRDLGYFALKTFKTIAAMGAYFLSRFQSNVKVYLKDDTSQPIDLGKYILKNCKGRNIIELDVLLGDEKVPVRLIAYHQPKDVTAKRIREANKKSKETGREISEGKKLSLHYTIFVTNVPVILLSTQMVGTIYRLRWEIELIFKRWKGQLQIDHLEGINQNRIDCLIWSRLCTVVIIEIIRGHIAIIVQNSFERELSDTKLIDYVLRSSAFCLAIRQNKLESFLEEMENDISRYLLKNKRYRRTMRERVYMRENYYDIQKVENQYVA